MKNMAFLIRVSLAVSEKYPQTKTTPNYSVLQYAQPSDDITPLTQQAHYHLLLLVGVISGINSCNNPLNSSYPFSSNLLSIWKCSNPQMLSESNQITICSNNSPACDQNIPWFDVDPCIGCGTVPVFSLFTSQFHQVHFWLSRLLWLTCHLLFLYHTPYYQKSRTQLIYNLHLGKPNEG